MLLEVAIQPTTFTAVIGIERHSLFFFLISKSDAVFLQQISLNHPGYVIVKQYALTHCPSLVGFRLGWFWVLHGLYSSGVPEFATMHQLL